MSIPLLDRPFGAETHGAQEPLGHFDVDGDLPSEAASPVFGGNPNVFRLGEDYRGANDLEERNIHIQQFGSTSQGPSTKFGTHVNQGPQNPNFGDSGVRASSSVVNRASNSQRNGTNTIGGEIDVRLDLGPSLTHSVVVPTGPLD